MLASTDATTLDYVKSALGIIFLIAIAKRRLNVVRSRDVKYLSLSTEELETLVENGDRAAYHAAVKRYKKEGSP